MAFISAIGMCDQDTQNSASSNLPPIRPVRAPSTTPFSSRSVAWRMGRLLGCRKTQSVGTFTALQSKDVHSYLIDVYAALEGLAIIAFGSGGGRKEKENKQRSKSEHLGLFALVGWRDCLVAVLHLLCIFGRMILLFYAFNRYRPGTANGHHDFKILGPESIL